MMKGHEVNFGANKLKSGSGEQVVYTLNRLADEALKTKNFAWRESVLLSFLLFYSLSL